MDDNSLLRLWGKSDDNDPENWHPLLFHLLDVGNVCRLLWDKVLPATVKKQIASGLGFAGECDEARRLVILLTAQHDLGKASAFQQKVGNLWERVQSDTGLQMEPVTAPGHGFVTTKLLCDLAKQGGNLGGWKASQATAILLAQITGGHHGKFPAPSDLRDELITTKSLGTNNNKTDWNAVRNRMLELVEEHLFSDETDNILPSPIELTDTLLKDASLVPLLGGLISVADWLGSSSGMGDPKSANHKPHFVPVGSKGFTIADYAAHSRKKAAEALTDFVWGKSTFVDPVDFKSIFPFDPNPMQAKVVECADAQTKPYLLIVEAAMGEGKTEAALYAIDRALTQKPALAHGFYIALPTQATSNALLDRVVEYLKKRQPAGPGADLHLQLAHGGSFLSEKFDKLRLAAMYDDTKDDNGKEGRVVAETWFTYRKRPLLAPFGVGTIDQSLVGVLQTKHWFVRLFGLAGKVVVFDEVHAYDVYMGELLDRLIGWLKLLGCTVILLSATLPEAKRRKLIEAWDKAEPPTDKADYPRVTLVSGKESDEWTVGQTNPAKTVSVAYTGLDFAALGKTLETDLPDGGCAVVICNTVARAQEAYQILSNEFEPKDWKVTLFHARTLAKWRKEQEEYVLDQFGKPGRKNADGKETERPKKAILIATQVVEQSLDLDFDWMASEIAPVDLLLQRMGRLWRHIDRKNRVKSAKESLFYVLCGDKEDNSPPDFPKGSSSVYAPYVLLRTRLAFAAGPLTLPERIEPLIRAVYDDKPVVPSDAWTTALDESEAVMKGEEEDHQNSANVVMIPHSGAKPRAVLDPGSDAESEDFEVYEDDDPRVHPSVRAMTRLGDPSISLICFGTDSEGKPLANSALKDTKPTQYEARNLLNFGVSLSQRGLFYALLNQEPPKEWKESAYLRFHRTLDFENGVTSINGYKLELRRTEGLLITKEGKIANEEAAP